MTAAATPLADKTAVFDFNQAVADARAAYPVETQNVTFVDLDDPEAHIQIAEWVTLRGEKTRDALMKNDEYKKLSPDSYGFAFRDPFQPGALVGIHTRPNDALDLLEGQGAKQAAYVFLHELGHLVVPADVAGSNPSEHAADAFAMIEGLRRGLFDIADVQQVANRRVAAYLDGNDLEHLTTASLDYITINPDDVNFISLTPKEVAAVARAWSRDLSNSSEDDKRLAIVHAKDEEGKKPGWEEMLLRVSAVAVMAPADSASFYLSARIMNAVFRAGLVDETKPVRDTDGAHYWQGVRRLIAQKTADTQPNVQKILGALFPETVPANDAGAENTPVKVAAKNASTLKPA